ncbi:MAG: hypothetical protein ACK56I_11250, partial [bacterium]
STSASACSLSASSTAHILMRAVSSPRTHSSSISCSCVQDCSSCCAASALDLAFSSSAACAATRCASVALYSSACLLSAVSISMLRLSNCSSTCRMSFWWCEVARMRASA